MLELYKLANQTAGTKEALRVQAIELARNLHASKIRRERKLATLSFEVRMGFSIAEKKINIR